MGVFFVVVGWLAQTHRVRQRFWKAAGQTSRWAHPGTPLTLSPSPCSNEGIPIVWAILVLFAFDSGSDKYFGIRLSTPPPPLLLHLIPCSVFRTHIHTDWSTYAIILVWIRSYHCPFGVCSLCESAAIVPTNWSSLRGEYTWLNIDPMWRGFADGRLTMGHCFEGATLFKSNLHHRVLLYTVDLQQDSCTSSTDDTPSLH